MPLYDYQCLNCGETSEEFFSIHSFPQVLECKCGGHKTKVIVWGRGGIFREEPTWLPDAIPSLQNTDLIAAKKIKPIEGRCEYRRYLKEHHLAPKC